jgi:fucose 4-O-acetylase-like acetyltransferase
MKVEHVERVGSVRDKAMDCIKGCLILMVPITHLDLSDLSPIISKVNSDYLMPWKMGLFFILSGILYKHTPSFFNYARWKFNRLVRPTIIIAAFLITLLPNNTRLSFSEFLWQYSFGYVNYTLVTTWFTMCLFVTLTLFNLIVVIGRGKKIRITIICILLTILTYSMSPVEFIHGASWINVGYHDRIITLPFRISSIFITLPLVCIGFLSQGNEFYKKPAMSILCAPIIVYILAVEGIRTDIANNYYSNYFLGTLTALLSLPLFYQISIILSKCDLISNILSHFAKNALFILVMHIVCFSFANEILNFYGLNKQSQLRTLIVFCSGLIIPMTFAYLASTSFAIRSILFGDRVKGNT